MLTHGVLTGYSLTGYSLTGCSLMGYSLMGYSRGTHSRGTHAWGTHRVLTHGACTCLCAASTAAGRCSGVRSSTSTRTAATSSLADGVLTATRVLSPCQGTRSTHMGARRRDAAAPARDPHLRRDLQGFADALTAAPPPPGTTCGRGADVHGEDQDRSILAAHGEPAARSSLRSGGCRWCSLADAGRQRPVALRPGPPLCRTKPRCGCDVTAQ